MIAKLRKHLIAGLLFWLPLWATFLVIKFIVGILNNTILLLPHKYQPDVLLGMHIPCIGVVITLVIIVSTGLLVSNIIGRILINWWEVLLTSIPVVNTVYTSVKQVCDTLFAPGGSSFRNVVLIEYPRAGLWTIALQTGDGSASVNGAIAEQALTDDIISVFVPTTPNPTGGFMMLVPRSKTIPLNMSVEQALKYIISLGVVQP